MARNHFREGSLRGRPIQAGRLEGLDAVKLLPQEVTTHILDVNGTNQASAICVLPGIWTPDAGTPIQLQDPERVATVEGTAYLFDTRGFSVSVWVRDPLTAGTGEEH